MSHTSTHKAMLQGQTTVMWQQVVSLATLEYLEKFAETFFFRFTDETGRKLAKNPNKSQRMNLSPHSASVTFKQTPWKCIVNEAIDINLHLIHRRWKHQDSDTSSLRKSWGFEKRHGKNKSPFKRELFFSFWTVFCVPTNDPIKNWNVCYFFYILLILTWLCIKGL